MKQNNSLLVADLYAQTLQFGRWALGWEWANLAFLAGGIWLLYQRVFSWHAPLAMLASLSLLAAIFYDGGSSASGGSPLFHLLSGRPCLARFYRHGPGHFGSFGARPADLRRHGRRTGVYHTGAGHLPRRCRFAVLVANFAAPSSTITPSPAPMAINRAGGG